MESLTGMPIPNSVEDWSRWCIENTDFVKYLRDAEFIEYLKHDPILGESNSYGYALVTQKAFESMLSKFNKIL